MGMELGLAVGRAGGAEDHAVDASTEHGSQQTRRSRGVVVVVVQGLTHRLADVGEGREVHDALDAPLAEHLLHRLGSPDIEPVERNARRNRFGMAAEQVVENAHLVPSPLEGADCVGADVARTACDENPHPSLPLSSAWP